MADFKRHLAGLSPYLNIHQQPSVPVNRVIYGAVYLFRHGVIETSHFDYDAFICPFLRKIHRLQSSKTPFVKGRLGFLNDYVSWITASHVGLVSLEGARQSSELGKALRLRYAEWLKESCADDKRKSVLHVWADEAYRCMTSAAAFATAFSGEVVQRGDGNFVNDTLPQVHTRLHKVSLSTDRLSINNLSWHTALGIDQTIGKSEMDHLMPITTRASKSRLEPSWIDTEPLTSNDIYSMQLLHCYDTISGRASPWEALFDAEDWAGFEYLRDVKYYYCEGYGREHTHLMALPWMQTTMDLVCDADASNVDKASTSFKSFPLRVAFTHRELVLYLGCLLGINHRPGWKPSMTAVDDKREWRVAALAPYLGHVGIESYTGTSGRLSVRVIVNGAVRPAFFGDLERDRDGGYCVAEVNKWLEKRRAEYDAVYGTGDLMFLREIDEYCG